MMKNANSFTARQTQVLQLLARQYTYDQMVSDLNISKNTLHTHLGKIMKTTGVHKQILLVKYAQENGYEIYKKKENSR